VGANRRLFYCSDISTNDDTTKQFGDGVVLVLPSSLNAQKWPYSPEIGKSLPPFDNEPVLIWGGASSGGSHAIQIARKLGLNVIATPSKNHYDILRSIGR